MTLYELELYGVTHLPREVQIAALDFDAGTVCAVFLALTDQIFDSGRNQDIAVTKEEFEQRILARGVDLNEAHAFVDALCKARVLQRGMLH